MFALLIVLTQFPELPPALVAFERARSLEVLATGDIEWSAETFCQTDPTSKLRFYTSRFAGADFTWVDRGDKDGVAFRKPDGKPEDRYSFNGPWHVLVKDSSVWRHVESAISCEVSPSEDPNSRVPLTFDVRLLGTSPADDKLPISEFLKPQADHIRDSPPPPKRGYNRLPASLKTVGVANGGLIRLRVGMRRAFAAISRAI